MALARLPVRHAVGATSSRRVCRSCSARLFSSTTTTADEAQQPKASAPVGQKPPSRRARDSSAAAFAAIQDSQQRRAREPQSEEPASLKGTVRAGSPRQGFQAPRQLRGLRYQPHNVATQSAPPAPDRPQFRLRKTPVDGQPQSGSARRDNSEALHQGARQGKPASKGKAVNTKRKPRQLQMEEEEDADLEEHDMVDEALDVTEEDLAASKVVRQKRSGVLAAHHGAYNSSYMRRRAAGIVARMQKYQADEELHIMKARMRPAEHAYRFAGKGSVKHANNRESHSLRGRSLTHMLGLRQSSMGNIERMSDSEKSKWDILTQDWVRGSYGLVAADAKLKKSKAAAAMQTVVNGYVTANTTYNLEQAKKLVGKLESLGAAARL